MLRGVPVGDRTSLTGPQICRLCQRLERQLPRSRCYTVVRAAKRKKGNAGDGGSSGSKGGGGGGGGQKTYKSPGKVSEGQAYEQETRKIILNMNKVSKVTPTGKEILKNISLGMYLGAKIGFLGANGAGKSTLMRIIAGADEATMGELKVIDGIKIGYLEQEPKLDDDATVLQNIEPALADMKGMLSAFEEVSIKMGEDGADVDACLSEMDRLQSAIDAGNGWELDRQIERATDALRCPPGDSPVKNLSGGERRRVALARLLLGTPDILLLDEPTNHLDAESVGWLERFLAEFPGTVVAITHDRYFLDNVAGWILELDQGQGIPFEGNYSQWLQSKAARLQRGAAAESSMQKSIAAELEWVQSNAKGQQKKGKARMRRYEDLVEQAAQMGRSDARLDSITIPVGPRLGSVVLEVNNLTKGFGDRVLIDGATFSVPPAAIVGIIGGNGAGKSTLFKMIMGQETPDGGTLTVGETVVPMYVEQSREDLAVDKTVYEEIGQGAEEINLVGRSINTRAYCSWFNFKSADQQKKVGVLSGGERNRLQLAKVLKQSGNLLMLDEPTNDLDVDTLRALETALLNFTGTALVISHDRWFLDRVATHILAFEGDSQVVWFEGGYSEYEADRRKRTGNAGPTPVKYRKLALA